MQVSAGLNHRKVMKAEPSRLIPWKPAASLDLLIVILLCYTINITMIQDKRYFVNIC